MLLVYGYNTSPAGYAAVYTVLGAWLIAGALVVIGLFLAIFPNIRRGGLLLAASGLMTFGLFIAGMKLSHWNGLVQWENQPLQEIGPAVKMSLVVYYKQGVTDDQMESFEGQTLDRSRSGPVVEFLRLLPSQADGHDGFAIRLDHKLPRAERERLRSAIAGSPLVARVYEDVSPDSISRP
jgi:hypothetical protein